MDAINETREVWQRCPGLVEETAGSMATTTGACKEGMDV